MTVHVAGLTPVAEFLDAPIPDIAARLAQRRQAKRREAVLAERGLMLTPLMLLAACGGGGGGSGPGPTPPPPPPTITGQPDAAAITAGAAPATGNVLTNDTTTSGTLTVSAVAVQGGAAGAVGQALQGSLGALTVNADGSYSFAVANNAAVTALGAGQTATETFTYTPSVGSNAGTAQTLTVTVTGVNDAPTAVADSASITEDAQTNTVTGNVRTNDTDPDTGAALTVSAITGGTVGQAVAGTYGSLVLNSDGSFTYTLDNSDADTQALNAGQTATETFTYTISDGTVTSTATLTINVTGNTDAQASNGSSVVTLTGGGRFGTALGTVQAGQTGDVTGDGRADLVIGAPGANSNGSVYVYSFSTAGAATLASTLNGAASGDRFGQDVSIGNLAGAASADVLVGAPGADGNAGAVYGFYDGAASANFTINTPAEAGTAAYPGSGDLGANLGTTVQILANINGGGSATDFFFAAPGAGAADIGKAYVAFGPNNEGATAAASAFEGGGKGYSVVPQGSTADSYGYRAAASGDVNGAGGADLILGDPTAGKVVIRYSGSPASGSTDNSDLNNVTKTGFILSSTDSGFGSSVAAGDINGDGRADVIVGAPGTNKVYVLLGAATFDAAITTAHPNVIEITGAGGFGSSVAYIGDFNGDGRGDFVVGAPTDGSNGSAYILLGGTTLTDASYNIATPGTNVIRITGGATGTGTEVAGPGDLNADGFADVAIAAPGDTGAVYIVFGRGGQSGASAGQKVLALDDGSSDMFDGSQSSGAATVDPAMQNTDLPPNDLFI